MPLDTRRDDLTLDRLVCGRLIGFQDSRDEERRDEWRRRRVEPRTTSGAGR